MAAKKENGAGKADELCPVASERNGIVYRCNKRAGHELRDPSDWEHVAEAVARTEQPGDFRGMVEDALPILYHVAENDPVRREFARRIIIRYHMSMTSSIRRARPPS